MEMTKFLFNAYKNFTKETQVRHYTTLFIDTEKEIISNPTQKIIKTDSSHLSKRRCLIRVSPQIKTSIVLVFIFL